MQISEKTVYIVNGQSFDSEDKARTHESDCIGEFMQAHLLKGIVFSPADRLKLHENILAHRAALCAILAE